MLAGGGLEKTSEADVKQGGRASSQVRQTADTACLTAHLASVQKPKRGVLPEGCQKQMGASGKACELEL